MKIYGIQGNNNEQWEDIRIWVENTLYQNPADAEAACFKLNNPIFVPSLTEQEWQLTYTHSETYQDFYDSEKNHEDSHKYTYTVKEFELL